VDRFEVDGRTVLIAKPTPPQSPPIRALTPRERAVAALVALGLSNKLIAYELGLAVGTVGNYLARAQHKLGANSRAALIHLCHAAALGSPHARAEGQRRVARTTPGTSEECSPKRQVQLQANRSPTGRLWSDVQLT
jgi:DNA-binding CsgD family transcriptional regulator